jgi:hypothetical protein
MNMKSFSSSPHACAFFSSPEVQRRFLSRFLKEGIEGGYRVIYTTPPIARAAVETELEEAGIDVGQSCQTGRLMMQNWNVSYCPDGQFKPSRTLRFFDDQLRNALKSGFSRVRFASHMEWAVADEQVADTLLEYEARANEGRAQQQSVPGGRPTSSTRGRGQTPPP